MAEDHGGSSVHLVGDHGCSSVHLAEDHGGSSVHLAGDHGGDSVLVVDDNDCACVQSEVLGGIMCHQRQAIKTLKRY